MRTQSVRYFGVLMAMLVGLGLAGCQSVSGGKTIATERFGRRPTLEQALEYARTVVLVRRVVHDNQIDSYVKEVWRWGTGAGTLPPAGSSYGMPMPYDPRLRFPERDAIVFEFGANRPKGLPTGWRIPVTREGLVPMFEKVTYERAGLRWIGDADTVGYAVREPMTVDEVRKAVENTKPKLEKANPADRHG